MNRVFWLPRGQWLRISCPEVGIRQLFTSGSLQSTCCRPGYGPADVRRTNLLNGMRVAAAKQLGSVIAACTVMFQAGSRFECDDQIGATHFVRACSSASGCGYTSFMKIRMPQQHGVSVTCSSDRQTMAFTLRCPLFIFGKMKFCLQDIAARCCFNQWEVDERKQLVRDDLTRLTPQERVMDLIQTASFTGGLANSMYCPRGRVSSMNEDDLNCFAYTNYKTDEVAVASIGIPFEETLKLAEMLEFRRDKPKPRIMAPSCWRAGFAYHDTGPGSETWVAVAVPGCGTCLDLICLLKHAIIAEACGTNDIASGHHYMDRTLMPPLGTMAGNDIYTQFRAFNISYRECGLFGVLVRTRACSAWKCTLAASEFLTNIGDLTYQQIEVGRARLKLNLALHEENCVRTCEGLALQLASCVEIDSVAEAMAVIDSIPVEEICAVTKILSQKNCLMSLAVAGDVGAVPHDRELLCHR